MQPRALPVNPACHPLTRTQAAAQVAVLVALFSRVGLMFLDFKGRPKACAFFYAVKVAIRTVKGGVVGAFYGELSCAAP